MTAAFRAKLTGAEQGMYDLMLNTSELLKEVATEAVDDLQKLPDPALEDAQDEDRPHYAYLHAMAAYCFTLGVQFAVTRQQQVAAQVAKAMGLIPKES